MNPGVPPKCGVPAKRLGLPQIPASPPDSQVSLNPWVPPKCRDPPPNAWAPPQTPGSP